MTVPFPSPTDPAASRREVFTRYLAFFRDRLAAKTRSLPAGELRRSRLPSGWTPLELVKHLTYVTTGGTSGPTRPWTACWPSWTLGRRSAPRSSTATTSTRSASRANAGPGSRPRR
jgi:hypothetical protein